MPFTFDGNGALLVTGPVSGDGAAGQVAFWTGAYTLDGDNNLYWDNVNKRLGVGTASPDRITHAVDDSASTGVIIPISRIESNVSGGAGATGHGPGFEYTGETTTTENTLMSVTASRWSVATHASRRSRFEIRNYYIANEVLCAVIEAPVYASVDGNARGVGAVDLQSTRTAVTQVASGSFSIVAGGAGCTASGSYAVTIGGSANVADGGYSLAAGRQADTNSFDGVLIWADSTNAAFTADRADQFKVRCNGGAAFVTTDTGAAIPVAEFNQADVDESFHKFVGDAAAADLTRDLVDDGDVTTATLVGWYKIEILDDGNQITDGTYYVPFYTLA